MVTPECTPPDGVSSAEVGYIIDNSADDRDILSLILWFASKGYLAVEGWEEDLRLVRKKGLPAGSPEYQTVFFDALSRRDAPCASCTAWSPPSMRRCRKRS